MFLCTKMDQIMGQAHLKKRLIDGTPAILRQVFALLNTPFESNQLIARESRDGFRARCIIYLSNLFGTFATGAGSPPRRM